ncbi:MAG: recombination protein RecR [Lentisphaerae bacterium]|nr:recombination protein RecR [Lentisphaerota bacterium]
MIAPLDNLVRTLARLPGLGRRSAERAALALVRDPEQLLDDLSTALAHAREHVRCCSECGGFTTADVNPCIICSGHGRDRTLICVVEEPGDIMAVERCGAFRGCYHALLGKLSPARMSGVAELRIKALLERVANQGVREVVLALSTDLEGDTTAGYLAEQLHVQGVRVTRLAFGLPADSGVGYSDPLTLKRALNGRQNV